MIRPCSKTGTRSVEQSGRQRTWRLLSVAMVPMLMNTTGSGLLSTQACNTMRMDGQSAESPHDSRAVTVSASDSVSEVIMGPTCAQAREKVNSSAARHQHSGYHVQKRRHRARVLQAKRRVAENGDACSVQRSFEGFTSEACKQRVQDSPRLTSHRLVNVVTPLATRL